MASELWLKALNRKILSVKIHKREIPTVKFIPVKLLPKEWRQSNVAAVSSPGSLTVTVSTKQIEPHLA